jgi:hypothetical protein
LTGAGRALDNQEVATILDVLRRTTVKRGGPMSGNIEQIKQNIRNVRDQLSQILKTPGGVPTPQHLGEAMIELSISLLDLCDRVKMLEAEGKKDVTDIARSRAEGA